MPKFPAFWVKVAFALAGTALLIVFTVWVTVVWAVATGS